MTSLNLKKGQSPPPSCYLENSILSNLFIGRTGFGFIGKHLEILSQDLPDSRLLMSSWRDLALTERVLSASITSLAQRMLCRVPRDFSDSLPTLGLAEAVSMNLVMVLLKADRLQEHNEDTWWDWILLKLSRRAFIKDWGWPQSMTILESCLFVNGVLWGIWN